MYIKFEIWRKYAYENTIKKQQIRPNFRWYSFLDHFLPSNATHQKNSQKLLNPPTNRQ